MLIFDDPGINLPLLIDEQPDEIRAVRVRRSLPLGRKTREFWRFDDKLCVQPLALLGQKPDRASLRIKVRVDVDEEQKLPVIVGLWRLNDDLFRKPGFDFDLRSGILGRDLDPNGLGLTSLDYQFCGAHREKRRPWGADRKEPESRKAKTNGPGEKPATAEFAVCGFFVAKVANLGANDPEKLVGQFASRGRTLARVLFQTAQDKLLKLGRDLRVRVSHSERRGGSLSDFVDETVVFGGNERAAASQ